MTTADENSFERRLAALERGGAAGGSQCTATMPHDTLSWDRRRYLCRCGKVYRKDGAGGLMEVSSHGT